MGYGRDLDPILGAHSRPWGYHEPQTDTPNIIQSFTIVVIPDRDVSISESGTESLLGSATAFQSLGFGPRIERVLEVRFLNHFPGEPL